MTFKYYLTTRLSSFLCLFMLLTPLSTMAASGSYEAPLQPSFLPTPTCVHTSHART